MSLIIHIICRSNKPITPRNIGEWFRLTGLLQDMSVDPDTDVFPEEGIEIWYKGSKRPITVYHSAKKGTQDYITEVLDDLESEPSKIPPDLRRRLLESVQLIDIDIHPGHIDELIWTAIDEVEAQIADVYDAVVYVPNEGFYNKKLKKIVSL